MEGLSRNPGLGKRNGNPEMESLDRSPLGKRTATPLEDRARPRKRMMPATQRVWRLVERYQRRLYYLVVGKVADDTEAKDGVEKVVRLSISRPSS
jgi:hypothetical protein